MAERERSANPTAPEVDSGAVGEGVVEIVFKLLSALALILMLVVVGTDIFTRTVLNFSFEIADEVAGYMLVALAFLSLAVCQVNDSFHRVEFLQAHMTPRGRIVSRLVFTLLMLLVAGLLLWQYVQLELASWRFGERAPTYLETPLWIPRLLLVAGMAALCWSLGRTIVANLKRLRAGAAGDGRRPDGP
jgi:TRAP-type C4-dicarboxylate transport system permease small subunit